EVLEHLEQQARYIEKCASLLEPHGQLLLTMPNRRAWKQYWAVPGRDDTAQPIENWLTPKELKQPLEPRFDVVSPSTHNARYSRQGLMLLVNSTRLNGILSRVGVGNPLRSCYEALRLGVFQFVRARPRHDPEAAV